MESYRIPEQWQPDNEPTVARLAAACRDLAEQNEKFAGLQRVAFGKETGWKNTNGVDFRVGLDARHIFTSSGYQGQEFDLRFQVACESESVPAELREFAEMEKEYIPEREHIAGVEVTYKASYRISCFDSLGWHITRTYDLWHDEETVEFNDSDEVVNNMSPEDVAEVQELLESEPEAEVRIARPVTVAHVLSYRQAPSFNEADVTDVIDPFAAVEEDVYLRQAQAVLEMLQFEDEGSFDLAAILPPEIIEELQRYAA